MGFTRGDDWLSQFMPKFHSKSELGEALRAYIVSERAFYESLDGAAVEDAAPYAAYFTAWSALDAVEECRLAAFLQGKLAHLGLAKLLKPNVITVRQQRLRDALADFVTDAPGGMNHILDLSETYQTQISKRVSMVSKFERAQMAAAKCRIPAAVQRLQHLRTDVEVAMRSGLIKPEDVVEKSEALHRVLSAMPGDFSAHLKALAMLRTSGLRLRHQKKPLRDWIARADDVLRAVRA